MGTEKDALVLKLRERFSEICFYALTVLACSLDFLVKGLRAILPVTFPYRRPFHIANYVKSKCNPSHRIRHWTSHNGHMLGCYRQLGLTLHMQQQQQICAMLFANCSMLQKCTKRAHWCAFQKQTRATCSPHPYSTPLRRQTEGKTAFWIMLKCSKKNFKNWFTPAYLIYNLMAECVNGPKAIDLCSLS